MSEPCRSCDGLGAVGSYAIECVARGRMEYVLRYVLADGTGTPVTLTGLYVPCRSCAGTGRARVTYLDPATLPEQRRRQAEDGDAQEPEPQREHPAHEDAEPE